MFVMVCLFFTVFRKSKLVALVIFLSALLLFVPLNWLGTHQDERNDHILKIAYYLTLPFSRINVPLDDPISPQRCDSCVPPYTQIYIDDQIFGVFGVASGRGLRRTFTWANDSRSVVLRPCLQGGQWILKYPGRDNEAETPLTDAFSWPVHDGITRCQILEQVQNFKSRDEALSWLLQSKQTVEGSLAYTSNGLFITWSKNFRAQTLSVFIYQILVNGKKPESLPGSNQFKINISKITP